MMVCSCRRAVPTLCSHSRLQALIRRLRWGLPAGVEDTPNIWNKISKFARQVITNTRGDWKKSVSLFSLPWYRSKVANNITQLKKSIESETHILVLAKTLTRKIPGFEIGEPFLLRLAVLVCTPLLNLSYVYN